MYENIKSVKELYETYNIKPLNIITEKKEEKVVKKPKDKLEVVYADEKIIYNNIFKHIVVFTNDRDSSNNKTLKNIEDAIESLKKHKAEIIPELHVFIAAEIDSDESESKITITDGNESFVIEKESNIDTLIFSRLGVQDEDQC